MRTEFSQLATARYSSLTLINCKHRGAEILTSFIYRWGELLPQVCSSSVEQCRNQLKLDLFSSQLLNEKIARGFIQNHAKTVACTFNIAKEEEKELLIIESISWDNIYPINEVVLQTRWLEMPFGTTQAPYKRHKNSTNTQQPRITANWKILIINNTDIKRDTYNIPLIK